MSAEKREREESDDEFRSVRRRTENTNITANLPDSGVIDERQIADEHEHSIQNLDEMALQIQNMPIHGSSSDIMRQRLGTTNLKTFEDVMLYLQSYDIYPKENELFSRYPFVHLYAKKPEDVELIEQQIVKPLEKASLSNRSDGIYKFPSRDNSGIRGLDVWVHTDFEESWYSFGNYPYDKIPNDTGWSWARKHQRYERYKNNQRSDKFDARTQLRNRELGIRAPIFNRPQITYENRYNRERSIEPDNFRIPLESTIKRDGKLTEILRKQHEAEGALTRYEGFY